jgi:hypothetical protein
MRRLVLVPALLLVAACGPPAETPAAVAPVKVARTAVALDGLPLGPPPRIGYVVDHRFVAPGGRRYRLPRTFGVLSVARLGDGFLVQDDRNFEGYTGLALVRRGRKVEGWSTTGTPVAGLHGAVAWGEATSSEASAQPPPKVRLEVGGVRLEQQLEVQPHLVGIVGDEVIFGAMFAPYPDSPGPWITDLVSPPRRLWVRHVADVDEVHERILGKKGPGSPAVMDLETLEPLWSPAGRGFTLTRFSPRGRLVIGEARDHSLVVVDSRSGEERGRITLPPDVTWVWQTMWETDRSILIVVATGKRVAILRSTPRGRIEVAMPSMRVPTATLGPGIVLTERS